MRLQHYIELQSAALKITAGGPGSGPQGGKCPGGDCNKHPVEAYGNKGMKSTPFTKQFKSSNHLNDWAEKTGSEVKGMRSLTDSEIPRAWKNAGYHEDPG